MSFERKLDWGKSASGNAIALYSSVNKAAEMTFEKLRPILMIGGVHGDEPEGVWLAEHVLNWVEKTESKLQLPWLLVTCLNPDGYKTNQRVNGNGVDLNRNFPCPNWTSEHNASRYFPGPFAGSESEVKGLTRLIEAERPQLILHFHSWDPCVVFTGEPARRDAERLAKSSGYAARPDIGYPTPGSLGEYGWKTCGIPVICIEEKEREDFDMIWAHFKKGFEEIFSDPTPRI